MSQEDLRPTRSKAASKSAPTDRTLGFDPEVQSVLDQVYLGADASAAKAFLDKYIWTKIWNEVVRLCNCTPDLNQLLMHRGALKAAMQMAQDLNLKIASSKVASDKLRELYDTKKIS